MMFEADAALVWCWDKVRLQQQRDLLPALWQQAQVLPETALQTPAVDGVRLCQCMDGVEAQIWQHGELRASRWWPQLPELTEYIGFCREASYFPAQMQTMPELQTVGEQIQPWLPVVDGDRIGRGNPVWEQLGYASLFLALALPYGWYSLRQQQFENGIQAAKAEMQSLNGQANQLVQARESALKAVAEIEARQRQNPYPSQIELMSAVAAALPSDATIREWEFQENKLRIVVAAGQEQPSRADVTKALTGSGLFAEVQNLLARDNSALAFRMTVLPKKGLPAGPDAATEKENNG